MSLLLTVLLGFGAFVALFLIILTIVLIVNRNKKKHHHHHHHHHHHEHGTENAVSAEGTADESAPVQAVVTEVTPEITEQVPENTEQEVSQVAEETQSEAIDPEFVPEVIILSRVEGELPSEEKIQAIKDFDKKMEEEYNAQLLKNVRKKVEESVAVAEVVAETEDEEPTGIYVTEHEIDVLKKSGLSIGEFGGLNREIKRIPFNEKLLAFPENVQEYYNVICNKFHTYKRVGLRVSKSCASFRIGRDLIAKISCRGKTMKFHLALDVDSLEESKFFQQNMGDKKAYEEVPFTVKVKSDRGLKRALELIDFLAIKNEMVKKTTVEPIDAIKLLKEKD